MSSIIRKIERNALKKEVMSNKIKDNWKEYMQFKYSYGELTDMYRKNRKRK